MAKVTSDCTRTRTNQAVLYDASVLHCGSAEISPYRLFIFIAKLNDDDDFVSSEYNPRFRSIPSLSSSMSARKGRYKLAHFITEHSPIGRESTL